jgi:hypothetical protein
MNCIDGPIFVAIPREDEMHYVTDDGELIEVGTPLPECSECLRPIAPDEPRRQYEWETA